MILSGKSGALDSREPIQAAQRVKLLDGPALHVKAGSNTVVPHGFQLLFAADVDMAINQSWDQKAPVPVDGLRTRGIPGFTNILSIDDDMAVREIRAIENVNMNDVVFPHDASDKSTFG